MNLRTIGFLLIGCLAVDGVSAETVELRLESGVLASAEYRQGQSPTTAAIILHGFLQTRNYLTVSSLIDAVFDQGLSVLAPTLSLGISDRKQSLPCEAVHTHSMTDDLEELSQWVSWLEQRGVKRILLIGHSFGSLQLLLLATTYSHASIAKVIATSLVDTEHPMGSEKSQIQMARALKVGQTKASALLEYQISYCQKYLAPPAAFISYAKWSREQILLQIKRCAVPIDVIIGDKDKRMDKQWPLLLKNNGVHVITVAGANHFFDGQYEFDLNDKVIDSINALN